MPDLCPSGAGMRIGSVFFYFSLSFSSPPRPSQPSLSATRPSQPRTPCILTFNLFLSFLSAVKRLKSARELLTVYVLCCFRGKRRGKEEKRGEDRRKALNEAGHIRTQGEMRGFERSEGEPLPTPPSLAILERQKAAKHQSPAINPISFFFSLFFQAEGKRRYGGKERREEREGEREQLHFPPGFLLIYGKGV